MNDQENLSASNTPDFEDKMLELSRLAGLAGSRGNIQEAVELIDQIIRLGEEHNVPTFNVKLLKEDLLMKSTTDKSKFVRILKDALAYYKEINDPLNQINTIISLINFLYDLNRIKEAIQYFEEAKVLVSSLTRKDIRTQLLSNKSLHKADFIDESFYVIELQSRLQNVYELLKGH